MLVNCGNCNKEIFKSTGHFNRSVKLGMGFYCDHKCHQATRKTSIEDKKAVKRSYDQALRSQPWYKEYKRSCWKKNYDPIKAAEYRQKRMAYHIEYCRQPEYVAWKKQYDQKHNAQSNYGEYAECAILIEKINNTLIKMADKAELRTIQGTNNKSKRRKKQWLRLMKNLPQLT